MKITLVGTGQVGLEWAAALAKLPDVQLSLCDSHPSPRALEWIESSGLLLHREVSDWISGQEIVLLCVPGTVIGGLVPSVLDHVVSGAVVVDLSTAGADTKQQAAVLAEAAHATYIDIAITGAVGIHGVRTPLLYAGAASPQVEQLLTRVGAPLTILPESTPGDAVAVKLLRSVIMKGLEALAVEALPAARAYGVLEPLLQSLGDVDRSPFSDLIKSMVTSHPVQAYRRHSEVLEAREQLERAGGPHEITDEVAHRYAATKLKAETLGAPKESTLDAALDWFGIASNDGALNGLVKS
ncbi:DUF1932 domain-containing protein [Glutamicibacter arilaitensis]|uniref:NAD(P)-dependent oxidoreductase n=1 Tax=Glutamicibacter arilaitensis TaxID=256701 RepID=UPI0038500397